MLCAVLCAVLCAAVTHVPSDISVGIAGCPKSVILTVFQISQLKIRTATFYLNFIVEQRAEHREAVNRRNCRQILCE